MLAKLKAILMSFFKTQTNELIFNDPERAKEYINQKISDVAKAINQACVNRASVQQSIEDLEKEIKSEEPKLQKEEGALREDVAADKIERNAAYRVFMRKQILEEKKKMLDNYIEQEGEYERLCFDLSLQREKLLVKKNEIKREFSADIVNSESILDVVRESRIIDDMVAGAIKKEKTGKKILEKILKEC